MTSCFMLMRREVERLGGEVLDDGEDRLEGGLVTPYGPVRLGTWKGDIVAALIAFPENWKGAWFGFPRWKVVFRLSNLTSGGMSPEDINSQFIDWLIRFYLPSGGGYPTIPSGYASVRPLVVAIVHLPRVISWPLGVVTLHSSTAVVLRLSTLPEGRVEKWLWDIVELALKQDTDWVVFSGFVEPDERLERFEGIDDSRNDPGKETSDT